MALSGKLTADFEDFYREAKKAEATLGSMERAGAGLGKEATAGLGAWVTGLDSVDRSLNLVGVNVGREIAALRELNALATMTTGAMGALGPAALAVGVALATWKVAELVRDTTQLDESLTDLVYDMFGLVKGSSVTTMAQDELRRASEATGMAITDLSIAMEVNKRTAQELAREQAALAAYEEQREAANKAAAASFAERFRARAAATAEAMRAEREALEQSATAQRALTNWIGEQEIKAIADLNRQKEQEDTRWRQHQNMLGELHMKNDKAQLDAEAQAFAAMLAKKKADYDAWWQSVNQGMLIVGQELPAGAGELERPQSLARPQSLSQRGVLAYGPGGQELLYPGATLPPAFASSTPPITVNMNGLLLSNDPGAREALSRTINDTLSRMMGTTGAKAPAR